MRGFSPSDFPDYATYHQHKSALDRAQSTSDIVLNAWDGLTKFTHRHNGMYWELQRLMHDAVQIGYESALGLPHRSSDYDITAKTLKDDPNKCRMCKHGYLVYGCEQRCSLADCERECELEVREYLD